MPELEWTYGYVYVILLMIASAVGPMLYFRKRGWLEITPRAKKTERLALCFRCFQPFFILKTRIDARQTLSFFISASPRFTAA